MVTPGRDAVIENIKEAVKNGNFNSKVEVGDPVLTDKKRQLVLDHYLKVRKKLPFKTRNLIAGRVVDVLTWKYNHNTLIEGLENIKDVKGGAFITANHFNPVENTVIRLLSQKMKRGNLYVISQDTNLLMGGFLGFLMYYMDIIPVSPDREYMTHHFDGLITEAFRRKQNILIYPEQEMWFNYRKPRPEKRGAFYYAARHNALVIPCFTEVRELPEMETEDFHKVQYVLHVLKPIYPDPEKTTRENSVAMKEQDYKQKVEAYEKAYGKKLDYTFEPWDIAGWVPKTEEK
ncbi:MAG: lysophospholipid acyltransferase family protein [Lachnospiraceae bacterium]|nr:lysophospholipid acyltransferase family protein [Lachnospiraceae bacterium]